MQSTAKFASYIHAHVCLAEKSHKPRTSLQGALEKHSESHQPTKLTAKQPLSLADAAPTPA